MKDEAEVSSQRLQALLLLDRLAAFELTTSSLHDLQLALSKLEGLDGNMDGSLNAHFRPQGLHQV
jgi:hypothetical protein